MNAEDIRQMRALLAAQPALMEPRASGLGHTLRILLQKRPGSPVSDPFILPAAPDPSVAEPETDLLLCTDLGAAEPITGDPVPPELLFGDLAPRRPAFGQRAERVLELQDPAPVPPRRLILCAAGGEAVGEIILRTSGGVLHAEAPFFPEDLADEAFPRPKRQPATTPAPKPTPPAPELAGTFLLANLAARLAGEEAALARRLTAARSLGEAA